MSISVGPLEKHLRENDVDKIDADGLTSVMTKYGFEHVKDDGKTKYSISREKLNKLVDKNQPGQAKATAGRAVSGKAKSNRWETMSLPTLKKIDNKLTLDIGEIEKKLAMLKNKKKKLQIQIEECEAEAAAAATAEEDEEEDADDADEDADDDADEETPFAFFVRLGLIKGTADNEYKFVKKALDIADVPEELQDYLDTCTGKDGQQMYQISGSKQKEIKQSVPEITFVSKKS